MLLEPYTFETVSYQALEAMSIVDSVVKVTKHVRCTQAVKRRALTCFAKLTQRLGHCGDAVLTKLKMLVKKYSTSMDLELQVRACEFSNLIEGKAGQGALARMPVVDPSVARRKNLSRKESVEVRSDKERKRRSYKAIAGCENHMCSYFSTIYNSTVTTSIILTPIFSTPLSIVSLRSPQGFDVNAIAASSAGVGVATGGGGGGGNLLDLDDIFSGGGGGQAAQPAAAQQQQQQQPQQVAQQPSSDMDLLSDIFAAPPAAAAPAAPASAMGAPSMGVGGGGGGTNDILDMFGGPAPPPVGGPAPPPVGGSAPMAQPPIAPAPAVPAPVVDMFAPQTAATGGDMLGGGGNLMAEPSGPDVVTAYSKHGLAIDFECKKVDGGAAEVTAVFKNGGASDMTALNFQVAVPKYIQMEMMPPSSTTVPTGGGKRVTQVIRVTNSMQGTKKMMMKLKISYLVGGNKVDDMATANNFPVGY